MLRRWLEEGEDDYQTWGALAKAVDRSGNKALGDKVRKLPHYEESSRGITPNFPACFYELVINCTGIWENVKLCNIYQ